MSVTTGVQIILNSDARQSGNDTDFVIVAKQSLASFNYGRLAYFSTPMSLPNVQGGYNSLSFTIADDASGTNAVDYTVTIADDTQYDYVSIATAIQSSINAAITPVVSTVTLNQNTLTTSIAVNSGKYIKVNGTDPSLNLMLGFQRTVDTAYGTTVYSVNGFNLNPYATVYLYCPQLEARAYNSIVKEQDSLLATLAIGSVQFGEQFTYIPVSQLFLKFSGGNVSRLRFYIRDSLNRQINNLNKLVSITLEFIYQDDQQQPRISR